MASMTAVCALGSVSSTFGARASLEKRAAGLYPSSAQLRAGMPCFVEHNVCSRRFQTASFSGSVSFLRHRCLNPEFRPEGSARRRRRVGRASAAQEDESTSQETVSPPPPPVSDKKAAAKAEVEKGQTTAIITGVISVLLGVGYLVLLQLLDTRGVNLVPPPPEAFDP